jgi:cell division protein FtsW
MTALILFQALLNVFAVLGLAPLTGVPLPFVSYGSTSLVVMLCAMGLLLDVASGGSAHVRAVGGTRRASARAVAGDEGDTRGTSPRRATGEGGGDTRRREAAGWGREQRAGAEADRDRRRRDGRARGAGARGGRRAAG